METDQKAPQFQKAQRPGGEEVEADRAEPMNTGRFFPLLNRYSAALMTAHSLEVELRQEVSCQSFFTASFSLAASFSSRKTLESTLF